MKKFLLTLSIALLTIIASAQVSITVNVPTAGGLKSALTAAGIDANTVTSLTVTGNINALDILFMNAMPLLEEFNLEATTIKDDYEDYANKFPDNAFKDNKRIKSIKLPKNITVIGSAAFENCTSLTCTLSIPNTVTEIHYNAFRECSGLIGPLVIPNSVTSIGRQAFSGCLQLNGSLTLPNSIKTIGESVFANCSSLTGNLTIPNSVTSIGISAFEGCIGLSGNLVLPNTLTTIEANAFAGCSGFTGSLIIPNSVTSIGSAAFAECNGFNGLTISNSIKIIKGHTFNNCTGLTGNLVIPNSVTTIESAAFQWCGKLTGTLTLSNALISIGNWAFSNCKFTGKLTIPSSVTTIKEYAFFNWNGITQINANQITPIALGKNALGSINTSTCLLVVPKGTTGLYRTAFLWKDFTNISEQIVVTYNSLGGTALPDTYPQYNTAILAPSDPTRTGYTFGGWYKEAACTNAWNFATDVVATNTTLYAKWNINSYTVAFDSQLGSAVTSITVNYNTTITAPTNPTRTGYTFSGWFKEAACTNVWNFATDAVTGNTTLYAKWTPIPCTVTFNSQGGNSVASTTVNYNAISTKPNDPTRTGYTFGGWYKEATCTNAWNFTTEVVTTNITLFAKWTINTYTVTFNSQGGSVVASKATNYNTTITAPSNPTRTGYTFGGWYKEAAGANAWNFTSDKVTANTTLYAKWTINTFIITFNTQGGSTIANATVNYNATVIRPADPTRTGYTFGGWYKEAAYTNAWNFTTDKITANTTLYAKWNINSYTVTFNSQGGDIIANTNANYNTTITTPVAPTRTGYTFGGWYKEAACTNAWNFATDKVTANTTLFAKWTINTYTVTFNSNGGTAVANVTAQYNAKISEPQAPTRVGHTFEGWYYNLNDDFPFNFIAYTIKNNTTLIAKWTPITYGVSFYSEGISINWRGVEYNTTISDKPEDPTRTGYIFNGWYKEATFINLWNFATDKVMSTMSLYAKWTALTYKVSYDSQGGTTVPAITVNHGTKISEPTPPTRKGYTLKGWYDQPTNGFTFFFDYTQITADITLYAQWTINRYSITFDSKGGTAVASQTVDYNSPIYAPTPPTRTGYTFDGWFKDEALTSAWNFATDVVSDNATLYANWKEVVYNVIFNSQGGSAVSNVNVNHGTPLTRPADPTRTGYTFAGWYIDANCTTAWNFATDVVTKATTLYAKWNINTYTVSFNAQGGSSIADVTCDYNNTIAEPLAPTRIGYTFAGWYKEYNYITAWNFSTDLVSNNTTLYAKWSINIYTVNFESQGGNAIASISATYNTTISAPTPPTRTGYKFSGWYKETACTNAWLFATDLVTENMSLYAKWDLSNSINSTSTEDFRLYPNPADDFVTLEGSNMKQASILNLMGTMIMQLDIKGNDTTTIDVGKLMSGNYFIYVETNDGKVKILKMLKL